MGPLIILKMPPLVLLLSFLAASGMGLRITDVTFPSYVMLDQTVTLVCDYRVSEVSKYPRLLNIEMRLCHQANKVKPKNFRISPGLPGIWQKCK